MTSPNREQVRMNPLKLWYVTIALLLYPAGAFAATMLTLVSEFGPLSTLLDPRFVAEEYARDLVNSGWLILLCLAGLVTVVAIQSISTPKNAGTTTEPRPHGKLLRLAGWIALSLFLLVVVSGATVQAMWFFSVSEEDQFFEAGMMYSGIEVGAPDGWRWAREGLEKQSVLLLAGEPQKKNSFSWEYDTGIEGATHRLGFLEDGRLVACEWYDGLKVDDSLDRAQPTIASKLNIDYPRCVPMAWSGESPNGFQVDVEIHMGHWQHAATYFTKNHTTVHRHSGMNAGRWHVRKLSTLGHGPWSDYVEFQCVR